MVILSHGTILEPVMIGFETVGFNKLNYAGQMNRISESNNGFNSQELLVSFSKTAIDQLCYDTARKYVRKNHRKKLELKN